jgi:hypothetical protein
MWYYLGKEKLPERLTSVLQPKMAFQESTTPRLCIAPSVAECIIALSLEERFYVHSIDVKVPSRADGSVGDRDGTREHWITQEVLDRHGGSISVKHLGQILVTRNMYTHAKLAIVNSKLPDGWEEKEFVLWKIEHEFWKPNFLSNTEFGDLIRNACKSSIIV